MFTPPARFTMLALSRERSLELFTVSLERSYEGRPLERPNRPLATGCRPRTCPKGARAAEWVTGQS
jgi:hypothetical protein